MNGKFVAVGFNSQNLIPRQLNRAFLTPFQQSFAAFCVLMIEICISLFFQNLPRNRTNYLSQALSQFLENPNRILQKNIFYGAIATQNKISWLRQFLEITNHYKPRRAVTLCRRQRGVLSLRAAEKGLGLGTAPPAQWQNQKKKLLRHCANPANLAIRI